MQFSLKIQKFKNPFFIILISFLINFEQFFFSYFTPFLQFHTFFSHLFQLFFCHCTTTHSYQSIKKKVSRYLRRFSKFGWGHDLWRRQQRQQRQRQQRQQTTPLRITIPWVDKVPQAKKTPRQMYSQNFYSSL